ncbi:MAG TPA: PfkB family carbohydrate kinase, partial [Aggregatilineales bacterium]|nr:PfkB family carbohydrate kinase [Aggregatilineales bacterium]
MSANASIDIDASHVDIIVSGHICLDLIPQMEHVTPQALATPGLLLEVGQLDSATGGTVANTGLALYRLGVKVGLMASVGDDLIGEAIVQNLSQIDPELVRCIGVLPGRQSSYSLVLSPQRADRTFLHCTGTNSTFDETSVDYSLLKRARIFHLGYPPLLPRLIEADGERLQRLFSLAKATGITTSMDMAMPDPNGPSGGANWPAILNKILPEVDVFLPSIEEILFMIRRPDYNAWQGDILGHLSAEYLFDLAGELIQMGTALAGFKLGELGLYLRGASAERIQRLKTLALDAGAWANMAYWQPAFQVEVAGTTGAGDAAYAGFLCALLNGAT